MTQAVKVLYTDHTDIVNGMTSQTINVPYMNGKINNHNEKIYIDTGATVSLISNKLLTSAQIQRIVPYHHHVIDANGNQINMLGQIDASVKTTSKNTIHESLLVYKQTEKQKFGILLGMNFLSQANIDFPNKKMTFKGSSTHHKSEKLNTKCKIILHLLNNEIKNAHPQRKLNILSSVEENSTHNLETNQTLVGEINKESANEDASQPSTKKNEDADNPNAGFHHAYLKVNNSKRIPLYLKGNIKLPGNTLTTCSIPVSNKFKNDNLVVLTHEELQPGVIIASTVTRVQNKSIYVRIVNSNSYEITLKAGNKLCSTEVSQLESNKTCNLTSSIKNNEETSTQDNELNDTENIQMTDKDAALQQTRNVEKLRPITNEDISTTNEELRAPLVQLLNKYRTTCWLPGEPMGKYTGGPPMEILLKEDKIINIPAYKIPIAKQPQVENTINEMLQQGVIKQSNSSYNSPMVIVNKPNGELRLCIDFRKLNEITAPLHYPLPNISELLSQVGETSIISKLDLHAAYWQCNIRPADRHKTAFSFKTSKFEFCSMPFGLANSPSYFAHVINNALYDVLGSNILAYMDDILITTSDVTSHLSKLESVLKHLSKVNLKLKIEKCQFAVEEVKFVGYKITRKGLELDRNKVDAIKASPDPTNKKTLQSFLGVINYYRRFIKDLATIASPLYSLLSKGVRFKWESNHSNAVKKLKEALISAPILRFPTFDKPFYIYSDASLTGLGAVLMQEHNNIMHPIQFVSKALNSAQRNYSTTKREALALCFAVEAFRNIILDYKIEVFTDHLPLLGVMKKLTRDASINRWMTLIQEYNITLKYLPGKKNIFADYLSRLSDIRNACEDVTEELDKKLIERIHISNEIDQFVSPKVPWSEKQLRSAQTADIEVRRILSELRKSDEKSKNFLKRVKVLNGILFVLRTMKRGNFTDEFIVPYIPDSLMEKAFSVVHEQITAGHTGYDRTLLLFKRNFYNTTETAKIKSLCNDCTACTKAKGITKPVPLLKYPIPDRPFEQVSSDILGPLPVTSKGNKYILVIRDFCTRYSIIVPMESKDTEHIITAFRTAMSNYGFSTLILTDNAPEYVSDKFNAFCNFYNINKKEIAPYHPSSQGLSERINKEINKLIRIYSNELALSDWDELMPIIQLTINNTYNASIKETPFHLLYGYDSPTIQFHQRKSYNPDLDHEQRLHAIRIHCKTNLLAMQDKYTNQANKNKNEKIIRVGDRVFAKLKKYYVHQKLNYPIDGPFSVTGTEGNSYLLKHDATKKTYKVHPDLIIIRKSHKINDTPITHKQTSSAENKSNNNEIKKHNYNLRERAQT